jgi:hypothetical protein
MIIVHATDDNHLLVDAREMLIYSVKDQHSLVYVGNLVDVIITCLGHPAATGQTYLVSDGEDVSGERECQIEGVIIYEISDKQPEFSYIMLK